MDAAVIQEKGGSIINQGEGTGNGKWKDLTNILKIVLTRAGDRMESPKAHLKLM